MYVHGAAAAGYQLWSRRANNGKTNTKESLYRRALFTVPGGATKYLTCSKLNREYQSHVRKTEISHYISKRLFRTETHR